MAALVVLLAASVASAQGLLRMDSRETGIMAPPVQEYTDPSFAAIKPVFTSAFNNYLAVDLNFSSDLPYQSLSMKVNTNWQWGSAQTGFVDFTGKLTRAMAADSNLQVFAAMGQYDLTTPVGTQKYTFDHLGLEEQQKKNITYTYYPSGHQVYMSEDSLKELKTRITDFFSK